MDRYDVGEFVGLAGIVAFCGLVWLLPGALLAGSVALLVEVQLRSRDRAPVRFSGAGRLGKVVKAARAAWADDGKAEAA